MHSALYHGWVTHHRSRPVTHALRYRIFMLLLDLDEAPALARDLRGFGFDSAGVLSFRQRDHGDGTAGGLRGWIDTHLAAAGLQAGGAVRVLCMPRVFGHAFNPLTVFFCLAPGGTLQAMLYEVNNTFGQRHSYLLPVLDGAVLDGAVLDGAVLDGAGPVRQCCTKMFHVSPFMAMDLRYRFRVALPGERAGVFIAASDTEGVVLAASFTGRRQALSDRALLRAALRMPLLGMSVLAGIHWEAFKLWLKGLKLRPAPPAPPAPQGAVTIAPQGAVTIMPQGAVTITPQGAVTITPRGAVTIA